ncbi:telomere-associated protein RIF1 isoform X1 [Dipodomys spectabilis]|uniref:telomere-associated protein RIF1 isoform X1 n=1 Tax=Dipodomys spectabilis TaxID=105255 RepID=UPI001C549C89|nr:telomere-associated protein RIF1 isoform X1 [Dipodomys spectabilis]
MTTPRPSPLAPLLETLEDPSASSGAQTDAYLTLTSRMTGEDGKEIIVHMEKNLPRLCEVLKAHISSQNSELSCAALQALGFCFHNPKITIGLSEENTKELLLRVNEVIKNSDKNVCTRALWLLAKQMISTEIIGKLVSSIIDALEILFNKGEQHSAVVVYEALNVIIRLIEQAPVQMGEEAVRWAKLVIPLLVHSAQRIHLRGATALEMGMPLLLQKQQEVASITEQLMTTKLISELQKLFLNKNETYVLKLWPLFVKLLGKTLHRSGSFINSLLQLEELGFRSGTPMVKKIAFIAWKSLIDNFALNPDILCSAKRLKLLMQPLSSIHVKTEALALTKLEVWWYLMKRLGSYLPANFEQVCVPLIQSTIIDNNASPRSSSSRLPTSPNLTPMTPVHKGASPYGGPATPRSSSSSSSSGMSTISSIQLLGLEMLLHFLLGPEVLSFAKQQKLVLNLEPLEHPLISSPSFFSKHAHILITAVHDSFVAVGKDGSDAVVSAIWKELITLVKSVTESGNKKERPGSEVLTLILKSLESIVKSEVFLASKTLVLMEITIKELPQKVLGSPAYQVANMDILNGTPALFLIQLFFNNNLLECGIADERFFLNLETLVGCVLSGPTSPLAFSDSVLNVINQNAKQLENKEHLWRMWSIIVTPLTEMINQTNEVNQGDALEHNFSAIYSALILPINHVFSEQNFPTVTMKTLLRTWSELYKAFARCAALVATAEENLCCEELSSKILSILEDDILLNVIFLDRIVHIITVMVNCIDFSPYNNKYQPQIKSPQRSSDWSKKKKEPLGKLASLFKMLVRIMCSFHTLSFKEGHSDTLLAIGNSIISILSNVLGHISLPSVIRNMFATLIRPVALFYENSKLDEAPKVYSCLNNKLEKLLGEIITCLQFSYTGTYDTELLEQLSPLLCVLFLHKNKQIRKQSALFWNATFAKVTGLIYPEELKPILREAKPKLLLLLPGLETVEIMEESSGPYSDTAGNSQLNVKISGMERKSSGKRDSFLAQTKDKKENIKPSAKLKLESSSAKVRSGMLLEEEKSTDFVFFPPEEKQGKERILTEHQKEVLKTKRYDIPTMYNNLDVSQDTLFSTQFSQEDSMLTPTLTEISTEDPKMIKEEKVKMESKVVTENCGIGEHLQKASLCVPETNPEILSNNNDDREITSISSKKTSTECTPSVENSFVVSSNSVSNSTISGTLPQPTSRRQTFITLEKFDVSGNRPFSPSALNNISSTVVVKTNQENMSKTDTPPKTKKREVTNSQSDTEKIVNGIKRLGRRSSKVEPSENKRSDPLVRTQPEEHTQESTKGLVTLENNLSNVVNSTGCMSGSPVHSPESTVEYEDTKSKPITENTILENSTTTGSTILENNTTEEKNIGVNLESKENTPPAVIPSDQMGNEDNQVQIAQNPKILRRSSRLRSETVESIIDSQDKENSLQKKERHKEEEKTVPKNPAQIKEDTLHKEKLTSEQTVQENLIENGDLHESTCETSANAEIDQNKRKQDLVNNSTEGHGSQDTVDKSFEKPLRGRTRYQTRRASQGLLSSIENSESDSSEAKDESCRKRRSGKWKNKNSDSVDLEEQEERIEEDSLKIENQLHDHKPVSVADIEIKSQVCEKDTSSTVTLQDSTVASDLLQVSNDTPNKHEGKSKNGKSAKLSLASPSIPESPLRTRNASKKLHKQDSDTSMKECSKTETSNMSVISKKIVSKLECHHKRSRRVRRCKACDCCGEKPQPQEKSLIELENTENYGTKIETTKPDVHTPETRTEAETRTETSNTCEVRILDEHPRVNFHFSLEEENGTIKDSLIVSETNLEESAHKVVPSETSNKEEVTPHIDSREAVSPSKEPSNKRFKGMDPCLDDDKDILQENSLDAQNPETSPKRELSDINDDRITCTGIAEPSAEEVEAMEVSSIEEDKIESSYLEKESAKIDTPEYEATEENKSGEPKADRLEELSVAKAVAEDLNSCIGLSENTTPENMNTHTGISDQIEGKQSRNNVSDSCLESEEINVEENEGKMMGQVNTEIHGVKETEDKDLTQESSPSKEAETERLNTEPDNFIPNTVEMSVEEGNIASNETETIETGTELNKCEETKLEDNQLEVGNDTLQEVYISEKVKEPSQSSPEITVSELITQNNVSPEKQKEFDHLLVSANESPTGVQTRCVWSPLASPSTSILKRGLKRPQEDEVSSPVNKVRHVSFADPIYQAGLADDIDRRSIVRSHSSISSPTIKGVKTSPTAQSKHNTTSAKGFLSPGSRSSKFKSSKKCLITEMVKESMLSPTESVYPALVNCAAPVDIILPQITSNIWARGLGQLIRAKNIKTIGDLSTLTASEIKALPIRSPKVINVKKALRVYHEQQVKSRGLEEIPVFDLSDKAVNGIENKSLSTDEEKLASDLLDPVPLETPLSKNLMAQISALALQLNSEDLHSYSGSQLFEMHEKLGTMANLIIRNLQSRWKSSANENSI